MEIRLSHVNYEYQRGTAFAHAALRDINLTIGQGELVGLTGHTGSGKSTLMQHFNGLLFPASGQVFVDGADITDRDYDIRGLRFRVGLSFQNPDYQLFGATVLEDIMFGPQNMGMSRQRAREMALEAMELVELPQSLSEKSPFDLSGGEKKKTALAGILAMDPQVLVLDEPAAGLDPGGRQQMLRLIEYLNREKNRTVIFVSHSMEDVARLARRVLVMDQGRLAMDGSPEKIFSDRKKLDALHLAPPQVMAVLGNMASLGYPVREDILTMEEAEREILRAWRNRQGVVRE